MEDKQSIKINTSESETGFRKLMLTNVKDTYEDPKIDRLLVDHHHQDFYSVNTQDERQLIHS